ncbi:MAG: hypothetical protein AAGD05_12000 [Bacteroidota bacterium]
MNKFLSYIAIIGIGAFAGNMINIGLSYGVHWQRLEALEFMKVFAIDFPLLLYPTAATLLPAFLATLVLYFKTKKGIDAKRYWRNALIGLLIINGLTLSYHLPLNLKFMAQSIAVEEVGSKLATWLMLHWLRIIIAIIAGIFAIKGLETALVKE